MITYVALCREWRADNSKHVHQRDEVCLFTGVLGLYRSSAHHWLSWLNAPVGVQYPNYLLTYGVPSTRVGWSLTRQLFISMIITCLSYHGRSLFHQVTFCCKAYAPIKMELLRSWVPTAVIVIYYLAQVCYVATYLMLGILGEER